MRLYKKPCVRLVQAIASPPELEGALLKSYTKHERINIKSIKKLWILGNRKTEFANSLDGRAGISHIFQFDVSSRVTCFSYRCLQKVVSVALLPESVKTLSIGTYPWAELVHILVHIHEQDLQNLQFSIGNYSRYCMV